MSILYAYCIFCLTTKCRVIAKELERQLDCSCISPIIIQRKWVKGVMHEESRPLLPGYIFLYSERKLMPDHSVGGIIHWLSYTDKTYELSGSDEDFARFLYMARGVIGKVKVRNAGGRLIIADEAWRAFSGEVTKVDRGRKRCRIDYVFSGEPRNFWVGYDVIEGEEAGSGAPEGSA